MWALVQYYEVTRLLILRECWKTWKIVLWWCKILEMCDSLCSVNFICLLELLLWLNFFSFFFLVVISKSAITYVLLDL